MCCFCLCVFTTIKLYCRKSEEENKEKGIEESLDDFIFFFNKTDFADVKYQIKCRFLLEHLVAIYTISEHETFYAEFQCRGLLICLL